jgi:hypothetical protein
VEEETGGVESALWSREQWRISEFGMKSETTRGAIIYRFKNISNGS